MDAVLAETEVEAYTIANEIEEKNPEASCIYSAEPS